MSQQCSGKYFLLFTPTLKCRNAAHRTNRSEQKTLWERPEMPEWKRKTAQKLKSEKRVKRVENCLYCSSCQSVCHQWIVQMLERLFENQTQRATTRNINRLNNTISPTHANNGSNWHCVSPIARLSAWFPVVFRWYLKCMQKQTQWHGSNMYSLGIMNTECTTCIQH